MLTVVTPLCVLCYVSFGDDSVPLILLHTHSLCIFYTTSHVFKTSALATLLSIRLSLYSIVSLPSRELESCQTLEPNPSFLYLRSVNAVRERAMYSTSVVEVTIDYYFFKTQEIRHCLIKKV